MSLNVKEISERQATIGNKMCLKLMERDVLKRSKDKDKEGKLLENLHEHK